VFFGAWICRNIPESSIKWLAGLVFFSFGTLNLYRSLPGSMRAITGSDPTG
jgi:putative Ca2+/H+ antiporter (TMEM165/GDT1 family)